MLKQYMSSIDAKLDNLGKLDKVVQSNSASIRNLELQMGQLAKIVGERSQGQLPSNTEENPRKLMAITLRSGKTIESASPKDSEENKADKEAEDNEVIEIPKPNVPKTSTLCDNPPPPSPVQPYVPPIPYLQRLKKRKDENNFKKFLDIFKKLHINIPFAEALAQMPSYAKFLKEIISNKQAGRIRHGSSK